jgi:hypothetical protein
MTSSDRQRKGQCREPDWADFVAEDEIADDDETKAGRYFPWTRWRGRAAAEIVARVTGCRPHGRGWRGLCPIHSEKNASFLVHVGDKTGKVTVNCFGCFDCSKDAESRWALLEKIQNLIDGTGKLTREEKRRCADNPATRAVGLRKGKALKRGVDFGTSIANAALNKPIRKLLEALENINIMGGGKLNGRLTPTTRVLERRGVRRMSIAAAVRGAEVLGVLRVKRGSYDRKAKRMRQTAYRLTYIPAWNAAEATDEWRIWEPVGKGVRAWKAALRVAKDALKQPQDGQKSATTRGVENGPKALPYKNATVVGSYRGSVASRKGLGGPSHISDPYDQTPEALDRWMIDKMVRERGWDHVWGGDNAAHWEVCRVGGEGARRAGARDIGRVSWALW